MDLKIEDVAELLNVSETTIRRWVLSGKIPAYKLNHQYRFSRNEIENWVMRCKLGQSDTQEQIYPPKIETEESLVRPGTQQFSLYRAIHRGGVYAHIPGKNKEEVIKEAMSRISSKLNLDAEMLTEMLLDRERLMPTALNRGIGVPHTRDFLLRSSFDAVFVVFPETAVEYGALDCIPVHTLFFLFASADKKHLHLLAKLAHLSSSEEALALLRSKPDLKTLLDFIRKWESSIPVRTTEP